MNDMSIAMSTREKYRTWESIYDNILVPYWSYAFIESIRKWNPGGVLLTAGQGACNAKVTLANKQIFNGSYKAEEYHAEMKALKDAGTMDPSKISRIDISSEPCPRCAVVLELKGLSGKVYTNGTTSTTSASGNWPISDAQELVDIITPSTVTASEKEHYKEIIFRHFQSAGWVPKKRK